MLRTDVRRFIRSATPLYEHAQKIQTRKRYRQLEPAIAELRQSYTGPLTIGADLQCTPVQ